MKLAKVLVSMIQELLYLLLCGSSLGLTENNLAAMERKINAVIRVNNTLPTIVRLAFHDCVGGCDGCLNTDNPDNAGLADIVADLDTVYVDNSYAQLLSRADFWAYAGYCALNYAVENHNDGCVDDCVPDLGLVFKYGRVDCSTSPYTTADVGFQVPTTTTKVSWTSLRLNLDLQLMRLWRLWVLTLLGELNPLIRASRAPGFRERLACSTTTTTPS